MTYELSTSLTLLQAYNMDLRSQIQKLYSDKDLLNTDKFKERLW